MSEENTMTSKLVHKMNEQELVADFNSAVENGSIYLCYQPQVNHSTGRMVGAEALLRWKHPVFGTQSPADFIPVLERNGLIFKADIFVFESVCRFLRRCFDEKREVVPISVNMSRYDIYNNNYVDEIEEIRKKYEVPVRFLRVEITESSAIGGMELMKAALDKLHAYGYLVEMDDFGSGYSSLNILKSLEVDIIKLDMLFMMGGIGGRGGAILSSIVQMTKWLNTPVIAEGVETVELADYMRSIGCNYIQGYLYSKPVPEDEFLQFMQKTDHEPMREAMHLIETMDAGKFWNPDSFETLIFNNYVGGACIFTYENGVMEVLRVNKKYIKELGMNMSEKDVIRMDPWEGCDEENRRIYENALKTAIKTEDEVSCETWRTIYSKCCGEDKICIHSDIRMIGKGGNKYIFYAMIHNITSEKKRFESMEIEEKKFKSAFEQVNVYAWEYTIATKQMRPCFRCMRDLGLPPLIENYPEPAIESGLFPPEYRDWMKKIDEGVPSLEGVLPLTVGHIPFHIRYTTEYDENGVALKAYGSAALVIDR